MNPELKEKLLLRKFASIEYIEELVKHHEIAVQAIADAVNYFYAYPPKKDFDAYQRVVKPFETKVLPNFVGNQQGFEEGLQYAKQGDFSYIASATGSIMGLSKSMNGIDWEWMDEVVDVKMGDQYAAHMTKAEYIASNIYYTHRDYWDPGEILDEEITGPIDEQDLLRYLKPGEQIT